MQKTFLFTRNIPGDKRCHPSGAGHAAGSRVCVTLPAAASTGLEGALPGAAAREVCLSCSLAQAPQPRSHACRGQGRPTRPLPAARACCRSSYSRLSCSRRRASARSRSASGRKSVGTAGSLPSLPSRGPAPAPLAAAALDGPGAAPCAPCAPHRPNFSTVSGAVGHASTRPLRSKTRTAKNCASHNQPVRVRVHCRACTAAAAPSSSPSSPPSSPSSSSPAKDSLERAASRAFFRWRSSFSCAPAPKPAVFSGAGWGHACRCC